MDFNTILNGVAILGIAWLGKQFMSFDRRLGIVETMLKMNQRRNERKDYEDEID
jgi:hypothetical protein